MGFVNGWRSIKLSAEGLSVEKDETSFKRLGTSFGDHDSVDFLKDAVI